MLPDDFQWRDRYQYAKGELALFHAGKQVAMLMRRAGEDGWMARLWAHWPVTEPLVLRDCANFEAGKAGIEAWATRHQGQIREEVATGTIRRP